MAFNNPKPGLTINDTRLGLFSLLYPITKETDETRDIYVYEKQDNGPPKLERHTYHHLDEGYRKQIKSIREQRTWCFYGLLALLFIFWIFFIHWFHFVLGFVLAGTLYEFMDRRIRHLWLKREYHRTQQDGEKTRTIKRTH
ncbi:MAG: hypothetical protein A2293_05150 [Elusimicrobia bacterium RIFOXYB2_FULL_49_7]|nr:MAG: hypothetical protein A2293_05150 [Elusimicrobia bacterium RIFOXYB2_FULL_49_7]